ncbi:hypothetical protein Tco_1039375, partial [Tanacetum coccineum]
VQQKSDGIFIIQDKYVAKILKKFDFATVKTASTPIKTNKALVKDEEAEARIFRYLKGQSKLGLWYPKDSPFDLEAFSDSDYAGASLDRKSTTGGCQFLGKRLISWQCKKQTIVANSTTEAEYVVAANCCGQAKHIEYLVGYKVVHKKLGDRMERAATTASSLEAEQDSGTSENEEMEITATIDGRVKTITQASIRRHLKLEDADGISSLPNTEIFEQLALMGYASDSGMKVDDFQNDFKQTKLTYGATYTKLILRVKKLEHWVKVSKYRRRTKIVVSDDEEVSEDPSKQGRIIAEIDQNPSILLILLEQEEPTELVEDLGSCEKGEKEISTVEVLVSTASAILKVSTVIPKRQVYIRRSAKKRKDKGKGIMKDDESIQKKTKNQLEQERLGHEEAIRLQKQINKEERQRIAKDA